MNIVDIIILVVIILGALSGFIRGFFKETAMFLGTAFVVVFAFILKNPLSLILYKKLPFFKFGGLTSLNILLYEILAFIISAAILSIVLAIIIKITGLLETVLNSTVILALPTKLLGMIVGIIQSIVLLYVALFILSLPIFKVPYINESKASNMILTKTPILSGITNNIVKTFQEIAEFTKNDIDLKDIPTTNKKIIGVMLKNKVITKENVKYLSDSNKVEISELDKFLENYMEG